jgi:hypothetical protein
MIGSIMVMIVAHFMSEQKSLQPYCFIPLKNWHKLINVFLLVEQCSLVLYVGGVSREVENLLFGLNLVLILVLQEKDSVHGQIKYSVIPLAINNIYFLTNSKSLFSNVQTDSPLPSDFETESSFSDIKLKALPSIPTPKPSPVNKEKVGFGMVWYAGTLVGYALMEQYGQGLSI